MNKLEGLESKEYCVIEREGSTGYTFKVLNYLVVTGKVDETLVEYLEDKSGIFFSFIYDSNTGLSYLSSLYENEYDNEYGKEMYEEANQVLKVIVKEFENLGYIKNEELKLKLENQPITLKYSMLYGEAEDGGDLYESVKVELEGIDSKNQRDMWEGSIPYPELIELEMYAYLEDEGYLIENEEAYNVMEKLKYKGNVTMEEW